MWEHEVIFCESMNLCLVRAWSGMLWEHDVVYCESIKWILWEHSWRIILWEIDVVYYESMSVYTVGYCMWVVMIEAKKKIQQPHIVHIEQYKHYTIYKDPDWHVVVSDIFNTLLTVF